MDSDIIVIGLGAIGAATLYQLASRGVRAIGIDRFAPPHEMGSSHGETRITRLACGEGAAFVPLVRRSHEIWRELEARTGATLMQTTGGLMMGPLHGAAIVHNVEGFVTQTIRLAEANGIAHEVLTPDQVMARFPQFRLTGDEQIYFEHDSGMLFPENCVRTQLAVARELGAAVRTGETVLGIEESGGGVAVRTTAGTLRAKRCVVSAGAWVGKLLGRDVGGVTRVLRQVLHWYEIADPSEYAPGRFPIFIWNHSSRREDSCYGFPASAVDGTFKIATEQYDNESDPDTVSRDVAPAESAAMFADFVAGRFVGVTPRALRAKVCLYTMTPDGGFIVDAAPEMPNVLIASACSGHAFKHSAGLGEAIAQRLVDGASEAPLDSFALSRFASVPA